MHLQTNVYCGFNYFTHFCVYLSWNLNIDRFYEKRWLYEWILAGLSIMTLPKSVNICKAIYCEMVWQSVWAHNSIYNLLVALSLNT